MAAAHPTDSRCSTHLRNFAGFAEDPRMNSEVSKTVSSLRSSPVERATKEFITIPKPFPAIANFAFRAVVEYSRSLSSLFILLFIFLVVCLNPGPESSRPADGDPVLAR